MDAVWLGLGVGRTSVRRAAVSLGLHHSGCACWGALHNCLFPFLKCGQLLFRGALDMFITKGAADFSL